MEKKARAVVTALATMDPAVASFFDRSETLFAVLLGLWLFGERFTRLEVAGLELDLELEVSGEYADHGIGPYEYWGARGVHHEWGWDDLQLSGVFFEPGDINTALRRRQPHLHVETGCRRPLHARDLPVPLEGTLHPAQHFHRFTPVIALETDIPDDYKRGPGEHINGNDPHQHGKRCDAGNFLSDVRLCILLDVEKTLHRHSCIASR